jgi:VWFA-related protein
MNSTAVRISLSLLLLLVSTQVIAQRQARKPRSDYTLKVDVDLRLLHVTVFDWKDQLVKGLTQENFEVYEDKIQQEISLFKVEDVPVSLGLVIDNSGSMRTKRNRVNRAALTFAKASNPADEIFLINFNDQVYLDQEFTQNLDDLTDSLDHIDARGGTALYDAIYLSLEHIREGKEEKKAVLVITDGQDRDSRYRFDTVLEFARESYASIYLIGLFDKKAERSRAQKKAAKLLKEFSEETGGKYFFPESVDEVHAICTQVAHEIRNQYTVGYKPTNLSRDGTWRDVTVKVVGSPKGKKKWLARTKRGYYAPTDS